MAQSLIDIPLHLVFSTKDRIPFIKSDVEDDMYQYICAISRNLDCPVIKINGTEDHIHILLSFGKTITICDLISKLKSSSSRWIKTKGDHFKDFSWQRGYGGFAVSSSNIQSVINYISFQKEHHKNKTFKEELVEMLNRARILYDERYLWD